MHLIHVHVHICIRRRIRRKEANGEEYEHEEMVITHYLRITNPRTVGHTTGETFFRKCLHTTCCQSTNIR